MGKDGGGGAKTAGIYIKTAGHVLTKMRGTIEDGRGWVMTAGDRRQGMSDK